MEEDEQSLDLKAILGAAESASIDRLGLFIPSKDRQGNIIFQAPWITRGMELLAKIGGGATKLPPAEGIWKDPENDKLLEESITIIYTHVSPGSLIAHLTDLREFLHSMGKETNQGEVVVEFGDRFYKIREFVPQSRESS